MQVVFWAPILAAALSIFGTGCAALTNPVAQGVPARCIHPDLRADPKDPKQMIPLWFLRRQAPAVYRLAAGDILGIFVGGVLGDLEQPPPVNVTEGDDGRPSIGYPIPVGENGELVLPLIEPIVVAGMTIEEARREIIRRYSTTDPPIVLPGRERVIVTLVRPRQTRVLVIRQDSPGGGVFIRQPGTVRSTRTFRGGAEGLFRTANGTGTVVYLPGNDNDVLTALTRTGGLPGIDAENEIIIQRGGMDSKLAPAGLGEAGPGKEGMPHGEMDITAQGISHVVQHPRQIIRIPLRLAPGQPLPFQRNDVVLHDGDIVLIEARDTEVFYTGGLLPSGEFPLPRDYDLDVVEAVAQVGGPLINGGVNSNNLSGALVAPGIGGPSPRLVTVLRPVPWGGRLPIIVDLDKALYDPSENLIITPGDVIILQEAKSQAVARYFTDVFNLSIFAELFSHGSAVGTTSVSVP